MSYDVDFFQLIFFPRLCAAAETVAVDTFRQAPPPRWRRGASGLDRPTATRQNHAVIYSRDLLLRIKQIKHLSLCLILLFVFRTESLSNVDSSWFIHCSGNRCKRWTHGVTVLMGTMPLMSHTSSHLAYLTTQAITSTTICPVVLEPLVNRVARGRAWTLMELQGWSRVNAPQTWKRYCNNNK